MSSNFHKYMADKFNKKKTINNDISRISNIHKKPSVYIKNLQNNTFIKHHFEKNTLDDGIVDKSDNKLYSNTKTSNNFIEIQNKINNNAINNDNNKILEHNNIINTLSHNKTVIKNNYNKYNTLFDVKHVFNYVHDIYPKNQPFPKKNKLTNISMQNITTLKDKVDKIVHVYQEKYVNHENPTGFGDFIRSCIFIIQFCNKNNINYDIIINHPIALFLNNFHYTYKKNNQFVSFLHKNTNYYTSSNWVKTNFDKNDYKEQFILSENIYNNYIEYLYSLPIINKTLYSYNNLFPIYEITENHIYIIKKLLEPTPTMSLHIEEELIRLNLINNQFVVIQIRSGDKYLNNENNNVFLSKYLNDVYSFINNLNHKHNTIVLIADNKKIKYLIHENFPKIKISFNNITHIGESNDLHKEELKNTLLDFYIMSKSSSIFSITSYLHGSGFSYWCSKIYNIPYNCIYLKN